MVVKVVRQDWKYEGEEGEEGEEEEKVLKRV